MTAPAVSPARLLVDAGARLVIVGHSERREGFGESDADVRAKAEAALAIEMGCEVEDIGHTIHPHPTLSESVGMAAEVYDGTITDLYLPKKK